MSYTLYLESINTKTITIESNDLQQLIGQLILTVISNKDYTFGYIENSKSLRICKASSRQGFTWYNINGVEPSKL